MPVAFLFLLFVSFLILLSIVIKISLVFSKSKFDGAHRLTVLIEKSNKKEAELLSFAPDTESISILNVTSSQSLPNLERTLETPIDGEILVSNIEDEIPSDEMRSVFMHYRSIQTNLTLVDVLRLWHFSSNIPDYSITKKTLSFDPSHPQDDLSLDKLTSSLFTDNTLMMEKKTIQIVNATGISGFGARVGRLINNMGGIVIEISTSDELSQTSLISYSGQKTYTEERLSKVLSFKTEQLEKSSLSDIVIILGRDSAQTSAF